eukprot:8827076-Pyramimonas_sp.AAC.1
MTQVRHGADCGGGGGGAWQWGGGACCPRGTLGTSPAAGDDAARAPPPGGGRVGGGVGVGQRPTHPPPLPGDCRASPGALFKHCSCSASLRCFK